MAASGSPTVRRRELANRLKAHRLRAGLTLEEAGKALEFSTATMSRIENGQRLPRARDVRDLCKAYQVADAEAAELESLAEASKESGWWEGNSEVDDNYATLIGLELAATAISEYRGATIPGLIQTAEYLENYIRLAINPGRITPFTEAEIEGRIRVTIRRQEILTESRGLIYSAFLDESVVRRNVGGADIMAGQLDHILALTERSNISIRMIPFEVGAHPGQFGGFCYIHLPQDAVSDVVYIDSTAGQVFLEDSNDLRRHRLILQRLADISLTDEGSMDAFRSIMASP